MEQNKKQVFPHSCTKKQLFKMYESQMSDQMIRLGINTIIEDNRKNMAKHTNIIRHAKCAKLILPEELKEFRKIYGLPRGFENQ